MKETYLAQLPLGTIGGEDGFGPFGHLGQFPDVTTAAGYFTQIVSNAVGVMTIIAGIWFLFMLVAGAFGYLTAGGDSKKVADATQRITSAPNWPHCCCSRLCPRFSHWGPLRL